MKAVCLVSSPAVQADTSTANAAPLYTHSHKLGIITSRTCHTSMAVIIQAVKIQSREREKMLLSHL